ncbi:MAG: DUF502 domain-containing protein [Elusimicrobia bacterium]|nr:DUF502 domain-containing protein [Elusimicrobiota bacterium]
MSDGLAQKTKRHFITGIIVILPVSLTAWIVWVIFRLIGQRFLPLFKNIPEMADLPLAAQMTISALLTLTVIWFIGLWARNIIGRVIFRWFETLILNTPVVSKIYKTIRQITDTMFVNKQAFKKAAFIEYPRKGIYTLVFISGEIVRNGEKYITVFVPSTPNPTTGYCIVLPSEEVHELNITVNQAMEFIFSGGILVPARMEFPHVNGRKEN